MIPEWTRKNLILVEGKQKIRKGDSDILSMNLDVHNESDPMRLGYGMGISGSATSG